MTPYLERAEVIMAEPKLPKPRVPKRTLKNVEDRDIARRAYELYQRRGGGHGRDVEDWLTAEQELRGN
jgi:hypothetical protein